MARRGGPAPALLVAAVALALAIIVFSLVYAGGALVKGIKGIMLTQEVTEPAVLYSIQLDVQPGQVYELVETKDGLTVQPKNSKLIEKIQLENVDVAAGDALAPHLYDWYLDGVDDYLTTNLYYASDGLNGTSWLFVAGWSADQSIIGDGRPHQLYVFGRPHLYINEAGVLTAEFPVVNTTDGSVILRYITISQVFSEAITLQYYDAGTGYFEVRSISNTLITSKSATIENSYWPTDAALHIGYKPWFTVDSHFKGRIMFVAIKRGDASPPNDYRIDAYTWIFDASFTNGTHYFSLDGSKEATPYGGVQRIPANETWLWLVKSLYSDGKLHIKYVPVGSVFRVYYNGYKYEWTVSGTPNAAGLVEDFAIDLSAVFGVTSLNNVTIELEYPSPKVRVYAPPGFKVKLVDPAGGWSQELAANSTQPYVDFAIPRAGSYILEVIGSQEKPAVSVSTYGSLVSVTVTDSKGLPLANARVWVLDPTGSLVAEGATDENGVYTFQRPVGVNQVTVIVTSARDGVLYHAAETVDLSAPATATPPPQASKALEGQANALAIAVIVSAIVLTMAIVVASKR